MTSSGKTSPSSPRSDLSIDAEVLVGLIHRSDIEAWGHFGIWFSLLSLSGIATIWLWGQIVSVPFLALYGLLYSMADHQAHDLSHGTTFRNRRANEVLFYVNSFMTLHEPISLRREHHDHHDQGQTKPATTPRQDWGSRLRSTLKIINFLGDFFYMPTGKKQLCYTFCTALRGRVYTDLPNMIRDEELPKVVRNRRIQLFLLALIWATSVAYTSWIPIVLLFTPRFWGGPLTQLINLTGHAGLPQGESDERRSCRSVVLNPILRFYCMNANYHLEHHLMPNVPFHALPRLNRAIRNQLPPPAPSLLAAQTAILRLTIFNGRRSDGFGLGKASR